MTHDPRHVHDDDALAARLRAALHVEADMVNPADDGLAAIRSRTAGARPWWQRPAALAVAAAVVLGLVVGGGAALLGGDDGEGVVAGAPSTSAADPSSAEPSQTTTTTVGSDPAVDQETAWVYYAMNDPVSGVRLYREQHPVAGGGESKAVLALEEMFNEPAQDPDYDIRLWPEGSRVVSSTFRSDFAAVEVDLPDGTDVNDLSYQQLAYTVTANEPTVRTVEVALVGLDQRTRIQRAPAVEVQGFIWLLSPTEGGQAESPVKIVGYGTAFEGTVSWEVRRPGSDEVVAEGFTQGGANGQFGEFRDTVELEPGTYEIRAFESSAEDGRPLHVDDKTFTVE